MQLCRSLGGVEMIKRSRARRQTDDPDQGAPHLQLNTHAHTLTHRVTHTGIADVSFRTFRMLFITKPTCLCKEKETGFISKWLFRALWLFPCLVPAIFVSVVAWRNTAVEFVSGTLYSQNKPDLMKWHPFCGEFPSWTQGLVVRLWEVCIARRLIGMYLEQYDQWHKPTQYRYQVIFVLASWN